MAMRNRLRRAGRGESAESDRLPVLDQGRGFGGGKKGKPELCMTIHKGGALELLSDLELERALEQRQ